jgi:hypothetical protein
MSEPEIAKGINARSGHRRREFSPLDPFRIATTFICAVALLPLGLMIASSKGEQARDNALSSGKAQAADAANLSGFVASVRRTQRGQHDRMASLVNQLIESADVPEDLDGQLAVQPIKIESAKANIRSAELDRIHSSYSECFISLWQLYCNRWE